MKLNHSMKKKIKMNKPIIKKIIVYLLTALLGLFTGCTVSINVMKNNSDAKFHVEQSTEGNNSVDSTTVNTEVAK